MHPRWRFRILAALGILAALALICVVFAGAILRNGIAYGGRVAGYSIRYGELTNHGGHLTITAPDVASLAKEPLFTAARIDLTYRLDRIFGGPYLYGISRVEIDRPKLTIVHHKDGSFNFVLPKSNGKPSGPLAIPKIHLIVTNGSVGLLDATRIFAHSRRLALGNLQLDADVDPKGVSHVTLGLALSEEGGTFPIAGRGTFDETRGYELSRLTAKTLALPPLIDYALNSTSLHVAGGVLNDLDARIYGLPDAGGAMRRHVSVTAALDHFQPYLNGIAKPLRDGRGALRVYDDGLAIPKVDGSIAGVPVRIAGAIYHLSKPVLRLGIAGRGDLRDLLTLSDAAKHLPASGPVAFTLFVQGDATQPTTLASFASPRIAYGRIPLDHPHGLVALHGPDTSILETSLGYDGATLGARGNVHVDRRHTNVDILANLDAPAERFPYAGALLGSMPLRASAVLAGADGNARATGVLSGRAPQENLSGMFSVGQNGVGTVGPIALTGPGSRELYLRLALERPRARGGAAFLSARDFTFSAGGPQPALPGIALPSLPRVAGTLDAEVAGTLDGKRLALGGVAHARGVRFVGYPLDDLTARASVTTGGRLALQARYRGALAPLAKAAGGKVAATGTVDIPLALVAAGPGDVLVQIHAARFYGASVAGVALGGVEASARVRGRTVDLYGARATLGGQDIVAQGRFGDGGTLDVSGSGIELASLRRFGLPVRAGRLALFAALSGSAAAPHVEGGVAAGDVRLTAAQVADLPLDANTGLTYDAGRLELHDALVRAGPAVAEIDGRVSGLRGNPKAATYTFAAHVREADIARLARIARTDQLAPEGTLEADLAVSGTAAAPRLAGHLAIPEGSLNGLRFGDASVDLAGGLAAVRARDGRVTVGSSVLGFQGAFSPQVQSVALHAPRLDLADFNDYFDHGDTLGGSGSLFVSARNEPNRIVTSGRVRLAHTRFRRFDVGDSYAEWSTSGNTIRTDAAVGAATGRIEANGNITLPATQPLRDAPHRAFVALETRATDVALGTWLPVFDVQAPLEGLANARATIRGSYPNLTVAAHADLQRGTAGAVAIRTATLEARAANGRATVTDAAFAIDNLSAHASGSAGLAPGSSFDLTLTARTPDAGALAKTLTGKTYDAAGSLTTTARVSGTLAHPAVADTTDARALRYGTYTLPSAHVALTLTRTRGRLSAEADLQQGRLLANGYAPLETSPPGIGPAAAPLQLELTAERIAFAQFAPLLPKGTQLAGLLDGKVGLVGSLANPGLSGTLSVTGGSFAGPQEKSKISNFVSELTFKGRSVSLHDTSADVGGGKISALGSLSVPDLTDPAGSAAGSLTLDSADGVFDVPGLFKGRVNGSLNVARAAKANARVSGSLEVTSARIPPAALLPKSSSGAASATPLPVALNLDVVAGSDVRLQGGPADIGAKGDLKVGGTLAQPTVLGDLESTGGTLSFYRTFNVQYPTTVTFDGTGVIPYVDALATTTVDNPATDVTLHVTGQATQLNIDFTSNPSYSRDQIVGILVGAQALGAVSGIANAPGSPAAQQNPFQAVAEGQLGSLLAQNILEPFSSQLGGAVGLNNLAINYTPGAGASVGAQKKLFKNVNAVFAESFYYPQRQSIGLVANTSKATAAQLTFFSQPQSNRFNTFEGENAFNSTNAAVTDTQPASGSSGFSLSLQRKF